MNARATVIVDGIVQGVGYREAVAAKARSSGLTGYVMNLKNGTVKIMAEGDEKAIGRFLEGINIKNERIMVDGMKKSFSRPRNRYRHFYIKFRRGLSDDAIEIIERLNNGLVIMDRLDGKQEAANASLNAVDSHLSSIGSDVKTMDANIKTMGSDIKSMDAGNKTMDSDIKTIGSDIRAMDSHMAVHFDRLDKKYDAFGATMLQVAEDLHVIKDDLHTTVQEIRRPRSA